MAHTTCDRNTDKRLPVPTSSATFTLNGQTYLILKFPEGKGPDLEQTEEMARMNHGKLITCQEAKRIQGPDGAPRTLDSREWGIQSTYGPNEAFRKALEPGEWGYLSDPECTPPSYVSYLIHYIDFNVLFILKCLPNRPSRAVLLKLAPNHGQAIEPRGEKPNRRLIRCYS